MDASRGGKWRLPRRGSVLPRWHRFAMPGRSPFEDESVLLVASLDSVVECDCSSKARFQPVLGGNNWGQKPNRNSELGFTPSGFGSAKSTDLRSALLKQAFSPSAKGEGSQRRPRSVDFRANDTLPPKVAIYFISGQQLDLLEKLGLPNAQVVTMKLFEHQVKVLIMPFLEENVLIVENRERNL